MNISNIRKIK